LAKRGSPGLKGTGRAALVVALGFVLPGSAFAADGSGTNNPQLLRGTIDSSCTNALTCNFGPGAQTPAPMRTSPPAQPVRAAAATGPNCAEVDPYGLQQIGCPSPDYDAVFKDISTKRSVADRTPMVREAPMVPADAAPAPYRQTYPAEPVGLPGLEADWSVTLRGTYNHGSNGERFGIAVLPQASLTRQMGAGSVALSGDAALTKEGGGVFRLSSGALDFTGDRMLNRQTQISGGLSVSMEQDSPYALDASSDIIAQPLIVTGSADVAIKRQSGRFGFEGRGNIERAVYGETELSSGDRVLNGDRNRLGVTGAGRVSYALSGRTDVFTEVSAERSIYDLTSAGTGVSLNSWTYAVLAGVSGNWDNVVVAEVSAGYGLRRFDSALLSDAPAALVNAKLTYRPDEPVEVSALFGTEFSAPESATGASAQIDYSASTTARYLINDRTAVRANLGGTWTRYSDTDEHVAVYTAGLGADFNVNAHTMISADYEYAVRDATQRVQRDNHQVSVGVTYSR